MLDVNKLTDDAAHNECGIQNIYSFGVKKKEIFIDGFKSGAEWERNRDKWNSINVIPAEIDPNHPDYSINVLVTDGKNIWISCYDYNLQEWGDGEWDHIIGWQPLPALPKSKPI